MTSRAIELRTKECEADALEAGAAILAQSAHAFGGTSPAVSAVEKALEIMLRKEAERTRREMRGGKSLSELFPDRVPA